MASFWGTNVSITVFGESHGVGVGVVIQGLPPNEVIDREELQAFLRRRAPGQNGYTSQRVEDDIPHSFSGIYDGKTTGAPLAAFISNIDMRTSDYAKTVDVPRPGHADYPAHLRYRGGEDPRGGGHLSGRLTAPLCIAGGICKQILQHRGITVGAHLSSVGTVQDTPYNPVHLTPEQLVIPPEHTLGFLSESAEAAARETIDAARRDKDSVGGVVECAILGLPAGLGDPLFDGVENRLAQLIFGIPAVKGLEFGTGFALAHKQGSEVSDSFVLQEGKVRTSANNNGGILGGITTGMPIIFRAAFKPTPSIGQTQASVNLKTHQPVELTVEGRHDPCIAVRGVACVEAAAALVALDLLLGGAGVDGGHS